MPLARWLRVGWGVLVADLVYWIWELGHADGDYGMANWRAIFNAVTFYRGWILFAVLLVGSYANWRANEADR